MGADVGRIARAERLADGGGLIMPSVQFDECIVRPHREVEGDLQTSLVDRALWLLVVDGGDEPTPAVKIGGRPVNRRGPARQFWIDDFRPPSIGEDLVAE